MSFVLDTMTDSDGTALGSHTGETGATWTALTSPEYGHIWSNRLVASGSGSDGDLSRYKASGSPAGADYDVEADIILHNSISTLAFVAISGRLIDVNNSYQADHYLGDGAWRLIKRVSGVQTTMGSFSATLTQDQAYRLKLNMVGTAIKLYVDGVLRVSVTDSALSAAGKSGAAIGLGLQADGFILDNFAATDAAAAGVVGKSYVRSQAVNRASTY